MPKIFEYPLQISLYHRLFVRCTPLFHKTSSDLLSVFGKELWHILFSGQSTQNQLKYTLQNRAYLKKLSTYTQEVLKSTLNIQKSPQKQPKALEKYSLYLLFPMLIGLFLALFNTNVMQLAQVHISTLTIHFIN